MRPADIAECIVASESFMWLMVGANHPEAHLAALRPAYDTWRAARDEDEVRRAIEEELRRIIDAPMGQP